jgi:hypothetical protein
VGRRWTAFEVGAALGAALSTQNLDAETRISFTQAALHLHGAYLGNVSRRVGLGAAVELSAAANRARLDADKADNLVGELGLAPLLDVLMTDHWHIRLNACVQLALRRAELWRSGPRQQQVWREPLVNATTGVTFFFRF